MPRYKYNCDACGDVVTVFHTIEEFYTDCEKCEVTGSMSRLLPNTYIVKQQGKNRKTSVGDVTKKYIEENRELLKKEKEELRKKVHDPA